MVVAVRGLLGLGTTAAVAMVLWRVVERTVAAVGTGRPARADELLVGITAAVALACVLWLALGLVLSLLARVPGSLGRRAQVVADVVTPRLLRQTAAFVLGVGVVAGVAPGAAVAEPPTPSISSSQSSTAPASSAPASPAPASPAPSTPAPATPAPTGPPTPSPDAVAPSLPDPGFHALPDPSWVPTAPTVRPQPDVGLLSRTPNAAVDAPVDVVVHRGDTLWSIAARHLGPNASDAEIAQAWPAWFDANRAVIGEDPDLILPGQVLRAPEVTVP